MKVVKTGCLPQKDGTYKPKFSVEQRENILKADKEAFRKEKERHKMASYRIEVQFGSNRRTRGNLSANIRVWESGKDLQGKGDVSMHFCADETCMKPFSARFFTGDVIVCPGCMKAYHRDTCGSQLGPFYRDTEEVCAVVCMLFNYLKADADIVVRWIKKDPNKVFKDRSVRSMTEIDEHVEKHWQRAVYPYWRILDDMHTGKDLLKLVKEFLL